MDGELNKGVDTAVPAFIEPPTPKPPVIITAPEVVVVEAAEDVNLDTSPTLILPPIPTPPVIISAPVVVEVDAVEEVNFDTPPTLILPPTPTPPVTIKAPVVVDVEAVEDESVNVPEALILVANISHLRESEPKSYPLVPGTSVAVAESLKVARTFVPQPPPPAE